MFDFIGSGIFVCMCRLLSGCGVILSVFLEVVVCFCIFSWFRLGCSCVML